MKKVGDLIGDAIGRKELLRTARAQVAMQRWPEAVGEILARVTEPQSYDSGTIWVLVNGSSWAQELHFAKDTVLQRLNSFAGEEKMFTELRTTSRKRLRRDE